ncbi:MAG: hypothetical protein HY276_01590 [Ignavibacteriales bacterium]|nr:hypothetical protein [Ignavibacteriales bacterium]
MKELEETNPEEKQNVELTREQLYGLVWSKPSIKLAKELGISDVAITKICKKLNIPKPYPGYWKRVSMGHPIQPPPLPILPESESTKVSIRRKPSQQQYDNPEILERIKAESLPNNRIYVTENLSDPHPLILQAKELLKNKSPDDYGRLNKPYNQPCLDIRVPPSSLNRALRIMNTLLKALGIRGYQVEISKGEAMPTQILVKEEKVRIYIIENVKRSERELTNEEKKKPPFLIFNRLLYKPTGVLTFVIDEYLSEGSRKKWSDGSRKSLEELLNEVIVGIISSAEILRLENLKRKEREQRWQEKELRRQKEEQMRQREEQQRNALDRQVQLWRKSQDIRAFLSDYEKHTLHDAGIVVAGNPEVNWLQWAYGYVANLETLRADYIKEAAEQFNKEVEQK